FELRTSPPPPDACSLAPGELRARGGGSSAESTRAARGRARKHVSVHILNTAARRAPRPLATNPEWPHRRAPLAARRAPRPLATNPEWPHRRAPLAARPLSRPRATNPE